MNDDRQIRSYHRAFLGELTLYSLGHDLRPWRPIPARGIFWVAGLELAVLIVVHALGLSAPIGTATWGLCYLVIPIGIAWLLTVAKIEGRRFHVAVGAWISFALRGRLLVGGVHKLNFGPSSIKSSRVRVVRRKR